MDTESIAVYCLCDDLLKAMRHVDDRQRQMNDAEVMTTAIVAALYPITLTDSSILHQSTIINHQRFANP